MNPTSRAAAFLLVAVMAFVLAQTASAAGLGLSVGVQGGALNASVDIATPAAEASVQASVGVAVPSVSAAVETGTVAARADVAARPPAASGPPAPAGRARTDPGPGTKGPNHRDRTPRDRSVVAGASTGGAARPLEPPAPLATRAAQTGTPPDVDLAPLPERSTSGWGDSVQAAAAGISGSPAALAGLLLVVVSLIVRPVPGARSAPRPSLHSFVLQRPG